MAIGAFAFALVCIAMLPQAVRLWRGQPNFLDPSRLAADYRLASAGVKRWVRASPVTILAGVFFFGGGGIIELADPGGNGISNLDGIARAGFLVGTVVALIGVVGVVFSFTVTWFNRPRRLIPPPFRPGAPKLWTPEDRWRPSPASSQVAWAAPQAEIAEYFDQLAAVMRSQGMRLKYPTLTHGPVMVGRMSRFRLRWLATKLNCFVVIAFAESTSADLLRRFVDDAMEYGRLEKGPFRGLQNGVATIAVLVARSVDQDSIALVTSEPPVRFALMSVPAIADTESGQVHFYQGNSYMGRLYAKWLRGQLLSLFSLAPLAEVRRSVTG